MTPGVEPLDSQPFVRLFGKFANETNGLELQIHDEPVGMGVKIHRAKEGNSFFFYLERKAVQGQLSNHIASDLTEDEYWVTGRLL